MKPWTYNGVEMTSVDQFPIGTIGFVYKIENTHTKKFYIGKKSLHSTRTKALTKKELALLTDKRLSKKKKVVKESDWKNYFGSHVQLKEDVKLFSDDYFRRTIICFCSNKAGLSYQEVRHQILNAVLETENCYNDQILGKFWRKVAK